MQRERERKVVLVEGQEGENKQKEEEKGRIPFGCHREWIMGKDKKTKGKENGTHEKR